MEVRRVIRDAHEGSILCVAYNSHRRELITGGQDGAIKVRPRARLRTRLRRSRAARGLGLTLCADRARLRRPGPRRARARTAQIWDQDASKGPRVLAEGHLGWVTGLAYASQYRLLFSTSIDSLLLVWDMRSKSEWVQRCKTEGQCHCVEYDIRRALVYVGGDRCGRERAFEPRRALLAGALGAGRVGSGSIRWRTGRRDSGWRAPDARSGRETAPGFRSRR
jgi:WD40 repeat protein